jgi:hypothetical protein
MVNIPEIAVDEANRQMAENGDKPLILLDIRFPPCA